MVERWIKRPVLGLCLAFIAVGASFYFEYIKGLVPCPLCIMQRLMVILLVFSLASTCLSQRWRWCGLVIGIIFAVAGGYFAARQVYLQGLPPAQVPSCSPSLMALLHYFPWQNLAYALFWGTGSCAKSAWQWLGLSMAAWSLILFVTLLFLQIIALCLQGGKHYCAAVTNKPYR